MSFAATHDARDQVRQATDIVDLVGGYIPLRRQGRMFVGLCPWHDDARPSLQVNQERQSWKCWVCNVGGDVFSFVMQREGVEFSRSAGTAGPAGRYLVGEARPSGDRQAGRSGGQADAVRSGRLGGAPVQRVPGHMQRKRNQLGAISQERGINPASCAAFHLGLLAGSVAVAAGSELAPLPIPPPCWRRLAWWPSRRKAAGSTISFAAACCFRFAIRRTAPSASAAGSCRDRTIRANTSTRARRGSFPRASTFTGWIWPAMRFPAVAQVVVVEGYTDVIMAHQSGLTNFVAVLGTALGPRHIRLLRRYADTITLLLDGDEAGQRRTNEVLELFVQSDVDLRVLTLPDGLDPCDFLLQRGAAAMREQLSGAVDALEHAIQRPNAGDRPVARHAPCQPGAGTGSRRSWPRRRVSAARRRRPSSCANGRCWLGWPASSRLRKRSSGPASRTCARDAARQVRAPRFDRRRSTASRCRTWEPYDAELLEILVRHPELVSTAVHELSAEQSDERGGTGHSADVSRSWSRAASRPISGRSWPNWRIRN